MSRSRFVSTSLDALTRGVADVVLMVGFFVGLVGCWWMLSVDRMWAQEPPARSLSPKPLYANLSSELSDLIELGREASAAKLEALALLAPVSREGEVAVSLSVADDTADPADLVRSLGGTPANVEVPVVEAYVSIPVLERLANQPQVLRIEPVRRPIQHAVVSEGARLHGATRMHNGGITGRGVKVGIIDLGFIGLDARRGSELPVTVKGRCYRAVGAFTGDLRDCQTFTRHGTAVSEILTDMAPGVTLYIANPQSRLDLRNTMRWMTNQGVRVINYCLGWTFDGPGDGTSPSTDSPLRTVKLAVKRNALWVNSAGNEAVTTWTGAFADADRDGLAEFSGAERNRVNLTPQRPLVLQMRWSDRWRGAVTDLDVYLEDANGIRVAASVDFQTGFPGHRPFEIFRFFPPSAGPYFVVVDHFSGPPPQWLQIQAFSGQRLSRFVRNRSIGTPADSASPGALAVGAAHWQTPGKLEVFSSRGPTLDGRVKPDLVGIDGVRTATWGRFRGTSQSAPHVSGLAALALELRPGLRPGGLAALLRSQARPRGVVPNNEWGHGLAFLDVGAGR